MLYERIKQMISEIDKVNTDAKNKSTKITDNHNYKLITDRMIATVKEKYKNITKPVPNYVSYSNTLQAIIMDINKYIDILDDIGRVYYETKYDAEEGEVNQFILKYIFNRILTELNFYMGEYIHIYKLEETAYLCLDVENKENMIKRSMYDYELINIFKCGDD